MMKISITTERRVEENVPKFVKLGAFNEYEPRGIAEASVPSPHTL